MVLRHAAAEHRVREAEHGPCRGCSPQHGIDYLLRTLEGDPATLPTIVLSLVAIPLSRYRRDWPLLIGIALFGVYVLRIGGDWMMGRFLTPAFALAVALIARAPWSQRGVLPS
jgi:hypothetical protein